MTPQDRQKRFDDIIKSEEHDEVLGNAIWGRHDGQIYIDEAGDADCTFCEETIGEKAVHVSDVGDSVILCLKCGKIVIVHAKSVIKSWIDNELTEREKEIDEALKEEGDGD